MENKKEKDKTSFVKRFLREIQERKDQKFREKIDRIYFNVDEHGNRFIKGQLHAVHDKDKGIDGGLTAWADKTREDISSQLQ